jgi:hypothetical protein
MSPSQNTRHLLQFAYWLQRALFWRYMARTLRVDGRNEMIRQTASWAKSDLAKWRMATFAP